MKEKSTSFLKKVALLTMALLMVMSVAFGIAFSRGSSKNGPVTAEAATDRNATLEELTSLGYSFTNYEVKVTNSTATIQVNHSTVSLSVGSHTYQILTKGSNRYFFFTAKQSKAVQAITLTSTQSSTQNPHYTYVEVAGSFWDNQLCIMFPTVTAGDFKVQSSTGAIYFDYVDFFGNTGRFYLGENGYTSSASQAKPVKKTVDSTFSSLVNTFATTNDSVTYNGSLQSHTLYTIYLLDSKYSEQVRFIKTDDNFSTYQGTKAGYYLFSIEPINGYQWAEGSAADVSKSRLIMWEIKKATPNDTPISGFTIKQNKTATANQLLSAGGGALSVLKAGGDGGKFTVTSNDDEIVKVTGSENTDLSAFTLTGGYKEGTANITIKYTGGTNLQDKTWTVQVKNELSAEIYIMNGSDKQTYSSLKEAINAAKENGGTIYVNGAIDVNEEVTVDAGNITIMPGDQAATMPPELHFTESGGLNVSGGSLTFAKGEGESADYGLTVSSESGAAVKVENGTLTTTGDVTFTGGGIEVSNGDVTLGGNVTFEGCKSDGNGGALNITGGSVTLAEDANVTMTDCSAENGGAIAVADGGTFDARKGSLDAKGNVATEKGGAIYVEGGNVTLGGGVNVSNNNGKTFGNGVVVADGRSVTVTSDAFGGLGDGIGLVGQSSVKVSGEIAGDTKLTVEFADPKAQLEGEGANFGYVVNAEGAGNTADALKSALRVKNAGYTFKPDSASNNLQLASSEDVVAMYIDGEGNTHDCFSIEEAIAWIQANGGTGTIYLVQYFNQKESKEPEPVTIDNTIEIPAGVDITFESAVRVADNEGHFTYYYDGEKSEHKLTDLESEVPEYTYGTTTKVVRGGTLTEEMIKVEGKLTLGNVILDGGADWSKEVGADYKDWGTDTKIKIKDENGRAGSAENNNRGVVAHAPVIVNAGELIVGEGATIQNNDNNHAAPGEGFGSENYSGGIRNEGTGRLTVSGTIKDCYSREGGAIMNVDKNGIAGDSLPSVTIKDGASITGNVSQTKGAAIQNVYGDATTTVEGGTIEKNHSLNDLGVLTVEEGANLTVSGGKITAGADENALYLYNKYGEEDILHSNAGAIPYVENEKAGTLHIEKNPEITGNVHIDDPCTAYKEGEEGKPYDPFINVEGYTGGNLTLDVNENRPNGSVAQGSGLEKVTPPANEIGSDGFSGTYYYKTTNEDGKEELRSAQYGLSVSQTKPGEMIFEGFDPDITGMSVTIGGKSYDFTQNEEGQYVLKYEEGSAKIDGITFSYGETEVELTPTAAKTLAVVQFKPENLQITVPAGARYLATDGQWKDFPADSPCELPNDIKYEDGIITVEIDGEERKIDIGERGAVVSGKVGELGLSAVEESETGAKLTIEGESGLEYRLLDEEGNYVGDGWISCGEDGKVTFEIPADGKKYTVVARTPAAKDAEGNVTAFAGPYAERGTLSALTSEEKANLKTYNEAYAAVEGKLWTDGEVGSASVTEHEAVKNAYEALSERLQALVSDGYQDVLQSYPYALYAEWQKSNAGILAKVGEEGTGLKSTDAEDLIAAIEGYNTMAGKDAVAAAYAMDNYKALIDAYKDAISDEIAQKANDWFAEKEIDEAGKEKYRDAIDFFANQVADYDLNPAEGSVAEAVNELKSFVEKTGNVLNVQYSYNQKATEDTLAKLSDARKEELTDSLTEHMTKAQTEEGYDPKTAEADFDRIIGKGVAEHLYLEAYLAIEGTAADTASAPAQGVMEAIEKAADAEEAMKAAQDGIKALLEGFAQPDTALEKYIESKVDSFEALDEDNVAALKNLKAVAEYLEAYKNIYGEEALDTDGNIKADVQTAIEAIVGATAAEGSTEIEAANAKLAEEIGKLLEGAYTDKDNQIITDAKKAAEDAETAGNEAQHVAQAADAVLGVKEKLDLQRKYDEIVSRNEGLAEKLDGLKAALDAALESGLGDIDEAEANGKAEALTDAIAALELAEAKYLAELEYAEAYAEITGSPITDAAKQAFHAAVQDDTSKDVVVSTLKDEAKKLLAAEADTATSQKAKDYLGASGLQEAVNDATAADGKAIPDVSAAVAGAKAVQEYYDSYKLIKGKEATDAQDTTVNGIKGAEDAAAQNEKLEEAVNALLDDLKGDGQNAEVNKLADAAKKAVSDACDGSTVAEVADKVVGVKEKTELQKKHDELVAAQGDNMSDSGKAALDKELVEQFKKIDEIVKNGDSKEVQDALKAAEEAGITALERKAFAAEAEKEFNDAYAEITGKSISEEEAKAFADKVQAAANKQGVNDALKEAVQKLLAEAVNDATSEKAKEYLGENGLQEEVSALFTDANAVPDVSAAVAGAKAVQEYYDSYKILKGEEATEAQDTIVDALESAGTVAEKNQKLAEEVGKLLDGLKSEGMSEEANQLIEDAKAAVAAAGGDSTVANAADQVVGVKEKVSLRNTFDELMAENGESMSESGKQALADELQKHLDAIDTAVENGGDSASMQSNLAIKEKSAKASLELKTAAAVAEQEYAEAYAEITGSPITEEAKAAFHDAVQDDTSKNAVVNTLKSSVKDLLAAEAEKATSQKAKKYLGESGLQAAVNGATAAEGKLVPDLSAAVAGAKAVQEYLDSYKILTGSEADLDDEEVQGVIAKLEDSTKSVAEKNATLAEEVGKLLENVKGNGENTGVNALVDAAKEAVSEAGGDDEVAKVADLVVGLKEKTDLQKKYDELMTSDGEKMSESGKTALAEELTKQLAELDELVADGNSAEAQAALKAKEAAAEEELERKAFAAVAEKEFGEAYAEITGKAISEEDAEAFADKVQAAENKQGVNEALKEAVQELLTEAVKDAASEKAKDHLGENGLQGTVGELAADGNQVPDISAVVAGAKAVQEYYDSYKLIKGEEADTADEAVGKLTDSEKSVSERNEALAEEVGKLLDGLNTDPQSEGIKGLIDGVKDTIDGKASSDSEIAEVADLVVGVKEKAELQRKYDELVAGGNMTESGRAALAEELAKQLGEIDKLAEGGNNAETQDAITEYLPEAETALELNAHAAVAEKEFNDAYAEITGNPISEEDAKAFAEKVQAAESKQDINEALKEAVQKLLAEAVKDATSEKAQAHLGTSANAGLQKDVADLFKNATGTQVPDVSAAVAGAKAVQEYYDSHKLIKGEEADTAEEAVGKLTDSEKSVSERNAALAEEVGKLLDGLNTDPQSEGIKGLIDGVKDTIDGKASSDSEIAEVADLVVGVKEKTELQKKHDELVAGSSMSESGKAALAEELEKQLGEIDKLAEGGNNTETQDELAGLMPEAEAALERKAFAAVAEQEYAETVKAITGRDATAEEKAAFSASVQQAETEEKINEELRDALKEVAESLVGASDSAEAHGLVKSVTDAIEAAIADANSSSAGTTVPNLSENENVAGLGNALAALREQEKENAKEGLSGVADSTKAQNLPKDLKDIFEELVGEAEKQVEDAAFSEYPEIEEKLQKQLDLLAAYAEKYEGESNGLKDDSAVQEALEAGLDAIGNAAEGDIGKEFGKAELEMEKEYGKQYLKEQITENDNQHVKESAESALKAIEEMTTDGTDAEEKVQAVKDLVEKTVPAIEGERFLGDDDSVIRKQFADIESKDEDALKQMQEDLSKLGEETLGYLNDKYRKEPYGYESFEGALEDRVYKAEFEGAKEAAVSKAESLLKECDGEFVQDANSSKVEDLEGLEYEPQKSHGERVTYADERDRTIEERYREAEKYTLHAQEVQRSVSAVQRAKDALAESGRYSDAQKAELQAVVDAMEEKAKATVPSETSSRELSALIDEAYEQLRDVGVSSVTVGDINPDKTPSEEGGTGDYGEGYDGDLWGIVEGSSMASGADLSIGKGRDKSKEVSDAIKQDKVTPAAGSALTEEQADELVEGKAERGSIDVQLSETTEKDGKYTVKVLLPEELRGETGHQVVRVKDDGSIEVFETKVEDGKYLVFTAEELGEFQILADTMVDYTWLIILLSVIIAVELVGIALLIFKKNGKKGEKTAAFAPLPALAAVIVTPTGAIGICIGLGVTAGVLAAVFVVLLVLKIVRGKSAK